MQAGKGQIGFKPAAFHIIINNGIGLFFPSLQNKPSGFHKPVIMPGVQIKALAPRPEGIFIDKYLLQHRFAHNRHPQTPVSQIMGITELSGRLLFPQTIILHPLFPLSVPPQRLSYLVCITFRGKRTETIFHIRIPFFRCYNRSEPT